MRMRLLGQSILIDPEAAKDKLSRDQYRLYS